MKGVVIHLVAALAAVPATWSSSALAQEEPIEEEAPPPPPPALRVRPRAPAPQTRVTVAPAQPRTIVVEERGPNPELMSSGALMFGIAYGTSVVVGLASDRQSDQYLYVPLAGPWMDLARREPCYGFCGVQENTNRVLLVANGLIQAAGAIQILGGLLAPETRYVTRVAKTEKGVHVAPMAGPGSVGVTAFGAF